MNELFTVANLFSCIVLMLGWSIKQELKHISEAIREAKDSANEAHKRIDGILVKQ